MGKRMIDGNEITLEVTQWVIVRTAMLKTFMSSQHDGPRFMYPISNGIINKRAGETLTVVFETDGIAQRVWLELVMPYVSPLPVIIVKGGE